MVINESIAKKRFTGKEKATLFGRVLRSARLGGIVAGRDVITKPDRTP